MPAINTKLSRVNLLQIVIVFSLIDYGHFTGCAHVRLLANGHFIRRWNGVEYTTGLFVGAIILLSAIFLSAIFLSDLWDSRVRRQDQTEKWQTEKWQTEQWRIWEKAIPKPDIPSRAVSHQADFKSHHFSI